MVFSYTLMFLGQVYLSVRRYCVTWTLTNSRLKDCCGVMVMFCLRSCGEWMYPLAYSGARVACMRTVSSMAAVPKAKLCDLV